MKRLATTMAAAVLMAHGTLSASPAPATPAAQPTTLKFQSVRKASAECRGTPTQMCVCYKLNCKKGALPPTPPPPPPPPPPPAASSPRAAEMPGHPARVAVTYRRPKPRPKRFRARFTLSFDMLPFQFDIAVSRHLALSLAFATIVAGKNASYYLGGIFGIDYYPTGPAPKGLRLSLRGGRVVWGKKSVSEPTGCVNVFRATVGWNWIWDNGFTIGLGFGKQLIHRGYKSGSKSLILFIPHLEFNMGVAF